MRGTRSRTARTPSITRRAAKARALLVLAPMRTRLLSTLSRIVRPGSVRREGYRRFAALAANLRANFLAYARAPLALRACNGVGRGARCFGRVDVRNGGTIRVGTDFALGGPCASVQLATAREGIVTIGNDVSIEHGTSISARTLVTLGNHVRVGAYCVISDTEFPLPLTPPEDDDPRSIIVGDDVSLGPGVTLMPGIRIGDRAFVKAGSVVTSDVPADAVVSGSPARLVRAYAERERRRAAPLPFRLVPITSARSARV